MIRHYKYECGTPQRFECPYCKIHLRQRTHAWTHIRSFHPDREMYCVDIATNAKLTRRDYKGDWGAVVDDERVWDIYGLSLVERFLWICDHVMRCGQRKEFWIWIGFSILRGVGFLDRLL